MAYSSGDYTFFVDGDDWIDLTLVERLVGRIEQDNADIVQTSYYYAYRDYLVYDERFEKWDDPPAVLDNQQVMEELVVNRIVKNFAWGKLYKTELIRDIPFQEGIFFEDVFWSHLVMQRVDTYVITHEPLYYYYQHAESIVASYSEKNLDFLQGLKQRHEFLEKYYSHLVDESYKEMVKAHLIHYQLLVRNRKTDPSGMYRTEVKLYIQKNYARLQKAVAENKELQLDLTLFQFHPSLYILFMAVKKVLRMMRLLPGTEGLKRIIIDQKDSGVSV